MLVQRWRHLYNRVRPHSALTYRPPAPETIEPLPPGSPELLDIGEQKLTQKWDNFRRQVSGRVSWARAHLFFSLDSSVTILLK